MIDRSKREHCLLRELLLDQKPVSSEWVGVHGRNPFHMFANDFEVLTMLFDRYSYIEQRDQYGCLPIHYCIEPKCLELFVKNKVSVDIPVRDWISVPLDIDGMNYPQVLYWNMQSGCVCEPISESDEHQERIEEIYRTHLSKQFPNGLDGSKSKEPDYSADCYVTKSVQCLRILLDNGYPIARLLFGCDCHINDLIADYKDDTFYVFERLLDSVTSGPKFVDKYLFKSDHTKNNVIFLGMILLNYRCSGGNCIGLSDIDIESQDSPTDIKIDIVQDPAFQERLKDYQIPDLDQVTRYHFGYLGYLDF